MKIKQLGNGGGFDFDKTNSSFLISNEEETSYVLFDCGYNVMKRLQDKEDPIDIEKIDTVIISHMDEDHIGNLKMLIYYRYFNFGKFTKILAGHLVESQLRDYLKDIESEMIGGMPTETIMFYINQFPIDFPIDYKIDFIKGYHGNISSYGVLIRDHFSSAFISGDTKANYNIEKTLNDKINIHKINYIFHDFSHWDNVTRNVHACETDFELEYSEEFKNMVVKYHTGDEFSNEWLN